MITNHKKILGLFWKLRLLICLARVGYCGCGHKHYKYVYGYCQKEYVSDR